MKRLQGVLMVLILFGVPAAPVLAQDPIVFPAKGQTNEQMEKEKFQCYEWAKGQTGFDPMASPTTTSPEPNPRMRNTAARTATGAGVGAAGGALIGALAGGGKGAGIGALAGGVAGGAFGGLRSSSKNKQAREQKAQWRQQQASQYAQRRNTYNRAYTACLQGKGYTVR